jgi:hypothetical protein
MRHGAIRAHAPAEDRRSANASSRQIDRGGLETARARIRDAAPVRATRQARVHETGAYRCVIVATSDKAASRHDDIGEGSAVNIGVGDL